MLFPCTLLVIGLSSPQDTRTRPELAPLLEQLVGLPTSAEREREALRLARDRDLDASVEDWLRAMEDFGEFEDAAAGVRREEARVHVGKRPVDMRLHVFVPEAYEPDEPAPLLVLAHGTGGTGAGLHTQFQTVAEELGMLILSPDTTTENAGYTFGPDERAETLAAVRFARRRFNVDERRMFLGGISRGGHLTWDVALRRPDLFCGLIPMVGGPRLSNTGGENTLRYLENVAHVAIRDLQGSRDDPGLLFNLRLAFERLKEFGAEDAELHEFPELGHSYRLDTVDWRAFFGETRREAVPRRVVRTVATLDEARASWLVATRLAKGIEETFQLRVPIKEWNRLTPDEQRLRMQQAIDEKTARVELRMTEPGVFEGEGEGVSGVDLLLTREMIGEGGVVNVRFNRRNNKRKAKESAAVLLVEFAERFDRTFLPVARVSVKR